MESIYYTNNNLNLYQKFYSYTNELYKKFDLKVLSKIQGNLRILTYNVHCFSNSKNISTYNDFIQFFNNLNADVLCLQEVDFRKILRSKFIEDMQRLGYNSYHYYRCGNEISDFGNMTLVKGLKNVIFQEIDLGKNCVIGCIDKCNHGKNSMEQRGAILCKINNINIINLHLDVWERTGIIRAKSLNTLLNFLGVNYILDSPLLICGDFNTYTYNQYKNRDHLRWILHTDNIRGKPQENALSVLINNNFTDIFDNDLPVTVWSGRRTDYMFINRVFNHQYKTSKAFFVPTTISDHYPLIVDIQS